jgi:hypothetical protein
VRVSTSTRFRRTRARSPFASGLVSLFLAARVAQDPPRLVEARKRAGSIDKFIFMP